mmetsp:Transcript_18381/g.58708  ORF Transcript_18381/g.58708 Transcript_18381/m.58708 type:complete len:263 (+) Transcript_18381:2579-3367(+)
MATRCRTWSATCTCTRRTARCGASASGRAAASARGSTRSATRTTRASLGSTRWTRCSLAAAPRAVRRPSTCRTRSTSSTESTTSTLTPPRSRGTRAATTGLGSLRAGCSGCRSGTGWLTGARSTTCGRTRCARSWWRCRGRPSGSSTRTRAAARRRSSGRCQRCCARDSTTSTASRSTARCRRSPLGCGTSPPTTQSCRRWWCLCRPTCRPPRRYSPPTACPAPWSRPRTLARGAGTRQTCLARCETTFAQSCGRWCSKDAA